MDAVSVHDNVERVRGCVFFDNLQPRTPMTFELREIGALECKCQNMVSSLALSHFASSKAQYMMCVRIFLLLHIMGMRHDLSDNSTLTEFMKRIVTSRSEKDTTPIFQGGRPKR